MRGINHMNKIIFLTVGLFFVMIRPCCATDYTGDDLISLVSLTSATATQGKVTSMLGKPLKIEEGKKRTLWYYTHGNQNMVISWNKESESLEKFFFTCAVAEKSVFDNSVAHKLKSGATDILQALKLLGTPKDITIKEKTQEMHYAYQEKVLRLFFRDRVLVDYCLY